MTKLSERLHSWAIKPSHYDDDFPGGASEAVYNVKTAPYSATGDGATDDQVAIQAAIDAAATAGGGVVYLPPGTYVVGQHPTTTNVCLLLKTKVTLMGAGEATVIKAKNSLPAAVGVVIATDAGYYGTTCRDFHLDGNSANQSHSVVGINWYDTNFHGPYSAAYGSGTIYGGQFHRAANLTIRNTWGGGLAITSCAVCFVDNCFAFGCYGGAFVDSGSDNFFSNCQAGYISSGAGFAIGSDSKAVNCKAYACGTMAFTLGAYAQAVNCEIQETGNSGLELAGSYASWIGGRISCGQVAVTFDNNASHNTIQTSITSETLSTGSYTTPTAVLFQSGNSNNDVRILSDHTPATAWISGDPVGNRVAFNRQGMGAVQAPAYAATVTPDAYAGDTVIVGTLTGNITIANPTNTGHKGSRLIVMLTQDGTGGRTVTWGANYKVATALGPAAAAVTTWEFVHNGTNWREIGAVT